MLTSPALRLHGWDCRALRPHQDLHLRHLRIRPKGRNAPGLRALAPLGTSQDTAEEGRTGDPDLPCWHLNMTVKCEVTGVPGNSSNQN